MFENRNKGRYGGHSRSYDVSSLSIFKLESNRKDYLDWEWICEMIFKDYYMSEVEQATYDLKHIQGPILIWWEFVSKSGQTYSALKEFIRNTYVPKGYSKLYKDDLEIFGPER